MKRVYQLILQHLGFCDTLTGTLGIPAYIPESIKIVAEELDDTMIHVFQSYLVIPLCPELLGKMAFADYIYITREWEDAEEC